MIDDQILTREHVLAIRAAHGTIMGEVDQMLAACQTAEERHELDPFGPPGYYNRRLDELCPADALDAWDRFLKDRREAANSIDPLTCNWCVTFTDCLDPYGIAGGEGGCIGRDFVVWDDNSNGEIESVDLSPEQYNALSERIEREAKRPVLSSFVITPDGAERMPMPSSGAESNAR